MPLIWYSFVRTLPGVRGIAAQLQAFCGLLSGRVPSIIRSIDPELSIRRSTFGGGGFTSSCCARAAAEARTNATPAEAAVHVRASEILMIASLTCVSFRALD